MELKSINNLKKLSISNLILIILNNKNSDLLRKCAEVELRKRVKNVGWEYNDLLHFDDKVIKERGLDVNNYLISPNVDMQQLMETYFMYCFNKNYDNRYLLFSEKHLCNNGDLGDYFFSKICTKEIKNLSQRIDKLETDSQKEILLLFKQMLEERNKIFKQETKEILKKYPIELLCHNEAMYQLDGATSTCHKFLKNCSDEETYRLISSNLGRLKCIILCLLNESIYDADILQYLCGLKFIRKDSSKLSNQKNHLLNQVKNNYEVNYESEQIKKVLQKIK